MDIIQLQHNHVIACPEMVKLTIGEHKGHWANIAFTVCLKSEERCLTEEAYEIEGSYYHKSEFDSYNIVYDNYQNQYDFDSNCLYGYIKWNEEGHFSVDADYVEYRGDYYISEYVAEDFGIHYCSDCENHYHEDNGCDCSNECERYCFEYHSDNRKDFSENSKYRIGFEVEKEDICQRDEEYAIDLFAETGWAKEEDGSLGSGGFELVSPVLPLAIDLPVQDQSVITDSIYDVRSYINAEYSKRCGGHINISQDGLSSKELLTSFSGYLPLFYAIYQNRIDNTYAKAKSIKHYIHEWDKYSSFHCKGNGVLEIRIFPAVKNDTNLLWRAELLRLILANPTSSNKKALEQIANHKNSLHLHLRKVFNSQDLLAKVKLFALYAKQFDDINIKQKTINHSVVKILKAA